MIKSSSTFKLKVKADPRIKKLHSMLESGLFSVNTDRLMDELETIHNTREIRTLSTSEYLRKAQQKLVDSSLENIAKRGRCVAIKMKAYRLSALLDKHVDSARGYLLVKYSAELANEYRLLNDRKSAVNKVLEPFILLIKDFQTVETLADMVIKDCDQTGYGISNMANTIQVAYSRERNI